MIDVKMLKTPALEDVREKIDDELIRRKNEALDFKRKNCKHTFEYFGTGRHGSSKGVDTFKCPNCGVYDDD